MSKPLVCLIQSVPRMRERKEKLERENAEVLQAHAAAVQRLAEVPGLGIRSAQQIIALVGPPRWCSRLPRVWHRGGSRACRGKGTAVFSRFRRLLMRMTYKGAIWAPLPIVYAV
jgi:transposase